MLELIELTFNHGVDRYEPGTGFGHIAIEVSDAAVACERSVPAAAW